MFLTGNTSSAISEHQMQFPTLEIPRTLLEFPKKMQRIKSIPLLLELELISTQIWYLFLSQMHLLTPARYPNFHLFEDAITSLWSQAENLKNKWKKNLTTWSLFPLSILQLIVRAMSGCQRGCKGVINWVISRYGSPGYEIPQEGRLFFMVKERELKSYIKLGFQFPYIQRRFKYDERRIYSH